MEWPQAEGAGELGERGLEGGDPGAWEGSAGGGTAL